MIPARSALACLCSGRSRRWPFTTWFVRMRLVGLAFAILSLTPIAPISSAHGEATKARPTHEGQFRRWLAETV